MQEVNITCPVFMSTSLVQSKGTFRALRSASVGLVEFSAMLTRAGLVLSVVHYLSATKMKLQTTTPSATPLHFCWMYTGPRRSGGQTTNNCRHCRLTKQREHASISWSRLVCSEWMGHFSIGGTMYKMSIQNII